MASLTLSSLFRVFLASLASAVDCGTGLVLCYCCEGKVGPLASYASSFLSRASLILLKPLHVLYPSLNAYFLKSSSSLLIHNESSNKLPAFMSFFYSLDVTKDEGDANASERMFALELLLCVNDIRCYNLNQTSNRLWDHEPQSTPPPTRFE